MKKVLHISSECYPAAKAGGMGDVVGALPLYLPAAGAKSSVIIPKYANKWFKGKTFKAVAKGSFAMGPYQIDYKIQTLKKNTLGYDLYCVDLPGLFDRDSIYLDVDGHGYKDEPQRNIAFQTAVVDWLAKGKTSFDILNCHDHMTGLIPFMVKYATAYQSLSSTPTVLTIHNGMYKGEFDWKIANYLPPYSSQHDGILDWDHKINSLATAIKCAWKVNTVSPNYMKEIMRDAGPMTHLYHMEEHKCLGILNGVDTKLWDPSTDSFLEHKLQDHVWVKFKQQNKTALLKQFGLKSRRPLVGFIGRLTDQKGADLLAEALDQKLSSNANLSMIILGTGDVSIEARLQELAKKYPKSVATYIAYDEGLARSIYAGCDYLIMPSRFEPCGLNQLFAMRYGTIPVVSDVGGLVDTVPDISIKGNGIVFGHSNIYAIQHALERAIALYKEKNTFKSLRSKLVKLDYSWSKSAETYAKLYQSLINSKV